MKDKTGKPFKIRRVVPEHQRLDLDAPAAGKSLLHDDRGMPRLRVKNKPVPPPVELPDKPMKMQAQDKETQEVSFGRKEVKGKEVPVQPMASVGMSEETMWFDDSVAVPSDPVATIQQVIEQINYHHLPRFDELDNPDDLLQLRANLLGKKGTLTYALRLMKHVPPNKRRGIGELLNAAHARIENAYMDGLAKSDPDNTIMPNTEAMQGQDFRKDIREAYDQQYEETEELVQDIQEDLDEQNSPDEDVNPWDVKPGEYLILHKGIVMEQTTSQELVKQVLEDLLLNKDVPLEEIQVLKSVPIDFGVLIAG